MNKVIAICGKVGSGKTYHAGKIMEKHKAVLLSDDEVLKELFPEKHPNDDPSLMMKIQNYLLKKAREIVINGTDVILDWGFWKKKEREDIDSFFSEDGIDVEWHYIDVSDEKWMEHISKRNQGNEGFAYFLPKEVLQRTEKIFEIPDKEDIDVWIKD